MDADEVTRTGERGAVAARPIPQRVGRYVILDRIGEGGMGVVYAAYDGELDRRIALKVLAPWRQRSHPGAAAGLLREAQALARLAHPHVVAVHDAGLVDGDAFVAMEYVAGSDLRAWLGAAPRARDAIVAVFVQAGRGLAAAHAAGIVHRDFKPANVLVGDDGRVRVVDFGLAADPAAPGDPAGDVAGTPAYMAPEQARGEAPSPLADQYSFGASLHEALTGQRPGARTPDRAVDPDASLPAWLQAIVRRALAPAPAARFPSMDALLQALARDPATRRRRGIVAAIVIGALGLGAAWLATRTTSPALCADAEDELVGVWDPARRQAARAAFRAVGAAGVAPWAAIERTLDGYAAGWVEAHTDACVATRVRGSQSDELLGRRMLCLERARVALDALVTVLARGDQQTIDRSVYAAGALPSLRACADVDALMADVAPPDDPETKGRATELRARLAAADALRLAGKYDDALGMAEAATAGARELGYPPVVAEALETLGNLQDYAGLARQAEDSLFEAWTVAVANHHDRAAAQAVVNLLWMVGNAGRRYDEAERLSRVVDATLRRIGDPVDLRVRYLGFLGGMANDRNQPARALDLMKEALARATEALGPDHPTVESLLFNLANTAVLGGRHDEALAFYQRDLAALEPTLGADHPDIARLHHAIGNVHLLDERFAEAAAAFRTAVAIRERRLGPEHADLGNSLNGLGEALLGQGELTEAEALLQRSLAIKERARGPDHPSVATTLENLGRLELARRRPAAARAYLDRALAIREPRLGAGHPDVGATLEALATAALLEGKRRDAEARSARAIAIYDAAPGVSPSQRRRALALRDRLAGGR